MKTGVRAAMAVRTAKESWNPGRNNCWVSLGEKEKGCQTQAVDQSRTTTGDEGKQHDGTHHRGRQAEGRSPVTMA